MSMYGKTKKIKKKKKKKKNPPAGDIKEGLIPVLGRSLEKEMAIYSSILAWEIPWTEEPGRLQSMASQRVRRYWAHTHNSIRFFSYILDRHQSTHTHSWSNSMKLSLSSSTDDKLLSCLSFPILQEGNGALVSFPQKNRNSGRGEGGQYLLTTVP